MVIKAIDAKTFQRMFLAGAKSIESKKEYINELNVFPVPDGDTGTNMTMTIMAAAKDVNNMENPTIEELAKAISSGTLRGARGNSGVILSQLFRGFTKEIKDQKEITVPVMAFGFQKAVETAYKAVMKPKEGTILTVARGGAEKAAELVKETEDLVYFGREVLKHMEEVLAKTPDLLPVLKEAGVVDSGGQGLVEILKGGYDAMLGKVVEFDSIPKTQSKSDLALNLDRFSQTDITFGYCTEFIIMLEKEFTLTTELEFKSFLESIGDSIVVVSDDDIVKVHVHTNDPGVAISKALTFGSLTSIKIDNMREEHNEKLIKDAEKIARNQKEKSLAEKSNQKEARKEVGFISVSIGEGINDIFKGLGVDHIIEGGQTMNPSTEDMLQAIEKVNANIIFIFPNNSNIILAAQQAKALTEDKNIIVIPSKTIPQGITAVINFVHDKSVEENEHRMIEEMKKVKTGQITYAVRDTMIDGKTIKQGNIMGLDDKTILEVGSSVPEVTFSLIQDLMEEQTELVCLYYGSDVEEAVATKLAEQVMEAYEDIDVEVHFGGQPIYYYIISVE